MESKNSSSSSVRPPLSSPQADQYGRKKFATSDSFLPPKPKERPPYMQDPSKSKSKIKKDEDDSQQSKSLKPVGRDFHAEEVLGQTLTITTQSTEEEQSVFYCKTCKVSCKDSSAYLDHINGKKHNRMLGMSMVVEKVGVEKVREKLAGLKRKPEKQVETLEDIQRRLDEEEKADAERKSKRRKREAEIPAAATVEEEDEDDEQAMKMQMMGLPFDFGANKNK